MPAGPPARLDRTELKVGRTSWSAFPAQHIVFSRRRRKGTPATTVVMKICTTEVFFHERLDVMEGLGRRAAGGRPTS